MVRDEGGGRTKVVKGVTIGVVDKAEAVEATKTSVWTGLAIRC